MSEGSKMKEQKEMTAKDAMKYNLDNVYLCNAPYRRNP